MEYRLSTQTTQQGPLVSIVTGAASGVGQETAGQLADRGYRVVATDVNSQGLEETVASVNSRSPGSAVAVLANLTDEAAVRKVVAQALDTFGRLDAVANVAGHAIRKSLGETTMADWYRMIDVNLTSVFVMCQEAARALPRGGAIVNVSSVSGFVGMGYAAYCAAKGGVIGLTKMLAVEMAAQGIRVNSVAPGPIATAFTQEARASKSTEEAIAGATVLKRFAHPREIAAAVVYLLSDDASFITGHTLAVDGGMTSMVNLGSAASAYRTIDE